jgi:hypothetical protein
MVSPARAYLSKRLARGSLPGPWSDDPSTEGRPVKVVSVVTPDGEQQVETGGVCLTGRCGAPAVYEVKLFDGWWYPQCAPCTARMRGMVLRSVMAARTYQEPTR